MSLCAFLNVSSIVTKASMFDWTSGINCATVKVRAAVYTSDMFTVKFPGSRLKIGLFKMAYC
jgi:hypothetical protein